MTDRHKSASTARDIVSGQKLLLVASTGGHLAELDAVAQLLETAPTSKWVTFDNAQSRSLLEDRPHDFVPYVAPRDLWRTITAYRQIVRMMRLEKFDGVLSTGAAVGVSAMLAGRRLGLPSVYVESLARLGSPSMTGKIVSRVPGVHTLTQHRSWESASWPYEFSVMDGWEANSRTVANGPAKVFVTVGTISPYRFDRLIDRLRAVIPDEVEVRWQLGDSMVDGLENARRLLDAREFAEAIDWADVVVSHAGVGNILSAMNAGASTLLVPRRAQHDEHVDDHQLEIAHEMSDRSLAFVREADEITWDDLCRAATLAPTLAAQGL